MYIYIYIYVHIALYLQSSSYILTVAVSGFLSENPGGNPTVVI